ncbi:zinc ABC transporter permease [Pleomorphomonas diazotrophica]|uniref:Zinc ABC transporter permease n=1 Tax=Pleomorphomonas diazotrophica TaxID=1166257 RepID=A0A1I4W1B2_9HYPH|nr:metal ABC transporter permease [Pleomorphomonas diazotrophica]PKR88218.1 zinc ABC transporter permease [Pleomorphomonas diazotrophica]SFN07220.1 zinc/manganese transport system permease protein [Pleomorphomonas diazotrophica]
MTVADLLSAFSDFAFMRRALIGCLVLSVAAAPIGVFLMLRRLSLTGDAMAHAILPGVAAGYLLAGLNLWAMTAGGLAAGLAIALMASAVTRLTPLREDASLATLYLVSLALGVILISARGSAVDVMHLLFGSVLAIDDTALLFIGLVASITVVAFAVLWRPLVLECVDPGFLRAVGGRGAVIHVTFMLVMVLNLIAGFQALGTLLSVGLMMLPAASARFWTRSLGAMTALAMAFAALSSVAGLIASFAGNLPSGPAIIVAAGMLYALSVALGPAGGLIVRLRPARHRTG